MLKHNLLAVLFSALVITSGLKAAPVAYQCTLTTVSADTTSEDKIIGLNNMHSILTVGDFSYQLGVLSLDSQQDSVAMFLVRRDQAGKNFGSASSIYHVDSKNGYVQYCHSALESDGKAYCVSAMCIPAAVK